MSILAHAGIDAHEKSLTVCVYVGDSESPDVRFDVPNDEMEVKRAFGRLARKYDPRCCYEASSGGYVLHRWLKSIGVQCEVIAPSLIPKRPGDKVKTDARDARNPATLYRAEQLTPVRIPTPAEEAVRGAVRLREMFVREATQTKNQVGRLLSAHGRFWHEKSRWTTKHWAWVRKQDFDDADGFVFSELLATLDFKLARVKAADNYLAECANRPGYKKAVGILMCLRGIGLVTAMTLTSEIGGFRRFGSAPAFMCFNGLVPTERSSGDSRRQGGITKAGNAHVRRVIVEAAWKYASKPATGYQLRKRQEGQPAIAVAIAWEAQKRLYKKFHSVAARKEKFVAVVAVARELAGFVWALMTNDVASA